MFSKSIIIEGGDQIGKGDVTKILFNRLIEKNISINKFSFPMYSSPFGYIIRKSLEEGFADIEGLEKVLGKRREIEIKMVCFAINRMEALESVLRSLKSKDNYFLFDRSPYSNALTIAYGFGGVKSIKKKDIFDLVKLIFIFDKVFIKTFNAKECVIHLRADYGKGEWEKTRNDGDLYEAKEVQEVVDNIYFEIQELVGDGWNTIYTKIDGNFRDRSDIQKEVDKAIDRLGLKRNKDSISKVYDILEISNDIYGVNLSNLDNYRLYMEYMDEEDNSKNKEKYAEAYKIGEYIVKNCKSVDFSNKEVKKNAIELLDLYPEVFIILNHYFGKEFVNKLKKSFYE